MRHYDILHKLAHDCAEHPTAPHRAAADQLCTELRQIFCGPVDCFAYQVTLQVFGSTCNGTHIPGSDADVAVIPTACPTGPRPSKGPPPEVVCDVLKFRGVLFEYLKRRYGANLVCEQKKAILLCGEERRTQADIVVMLPRNWQHGICPSCRKPRCSHGFELRSTCDRELPIATWPDQHRDNASAFDRETEGSYKRAVRAAKGILKAGIAEFYNIANHIPSVLVENLFACVPAPTYLRAGSCPYEVVKSVLSALIDDFYSGRAHQFSELSGRRNLFVPEQTWNYFQVHNGLTRIRSYL